MDDSIIKDIVLNNKPIITLGDEINIRGILGENSVDSTGFNDEFKSEVKNDADTEQEDFKFNTHYEVEDYIPRVSSDFAAKYELLARSVVDSTLVPVAIHKSGFNCPVCEKSFPERRYLNRHLSKHNGRFTCPHCKKSFLRKETKLKHIPRCKVLHPKYPKEPKKRTPGKQRNRKIQKFVCEECGQEYTRKENYEQHLWKHRGISVVCETCNKVYTTLKSCKAHQKLHGSTREIFFCEHCPKIFLFKSNLRRHIRKHFSKIICDKCSRRVKTMNLLEEHKKNATIKCVLCPLLFCLEKDLKHHRKSVHPNLWFNCKLCGNPKTRFMTVSELRLQEHTRKSHHVCLTFSNCYEQGWYLALD